MQINRGDLVRVRLANFKGFKKGIVLDVGCCPAVRWNKATSPTSISRGGNQCKSVV
jgi:hypothetical protein